MENVYGFLEDNVFKIICGLASLALISFIVFFWKKKTKCVDPQKIRDEITEKLEMKQHIVDEKNERLNTIKSIRKKAEDEIGKLSKIRDSILNKVKEGMNQPIDLKQNMKEISKLSKIINSIYKKTNKEIKCQLEIIEKLDQKLKSLDK